MKKRVISLIMAVTLSMSMFMLVGCNDAEKKLQQQIDDLNALLTEQAGKITEIEAEKQVLQEKVEDLERSKIEQENKIVELETDNDKLKDRIVNLAWETETNIVDIVSLGQLYNEGKLSKEELRNAAYYNSLALGGDGKISEKIDGKWEEYEYTPTVPQPNLDEEDIKRLEKIAALWYYYDIKEDYAEVGITLTPNRMLNSVHIKACVGVSNNMYIVICKHDWEQEGYPIFSAVVIGDFQFKHIVNYGTEVIVF